MELLNEIIQLEHKISRVLALSRNKENVITEKYRHRIKILTEIIKKQ